MKLHQAFRKDVDMMINASSAEEAVQIAYSLGEKGETVLLSPACASFDLFENLRIISNNETSRLLLLMLEISMSSS